MTTTTTQAQADNKSYKLKGVLITVFIILITIFVWFIKSDVSAAHALSFTFHQSPVLVALIFAVAILWLVFVVKGVITQTDLMTSFGWPYFVLGIVWFACWAIIGVSRYNCANDVNVKARYDVYAAEKGFAK